MNARHDRVAQALAQHPTIRMAHRPAMERYVGSSLQFRIPGLHALAATNFIADLVLRGVEVKWFGAAQPVAFTSAHHSWRYVAAQALPQTDRILSTLFDMRLPLTFTLDDCDLIAAHILQAADLLPQIAAA